MMYWLTTARWSLFRHIEAQFGVAPPGPGEPLAMEAGYAPAAELFQTTYEVAPRSCRRSVSEHLRQHGLAIGLVAGQAPLIAAVLGSYPITPA